MTHTKQEQKYNNKVTEIVRVKQVISERPVSYETTITSSVLAKQLGIKEIGDEAQEVLLVVALSTKNQINAIHRVFTGSINQSVAHPREIFRSALLNNAARILIYHNHPSGDVLPDVLPSEADKQFTKKLFKVGELLGIDVLDHIIVSEDDAFSFRESQF